MARITKAQIAKYLSLEEERKSFQRQADNCAKSADKIKAKIMAVCRADGGKEKTVTRLGYVLAIRLLAGTVAWKQQFIRVKGIKAAERLIKRAAKREALFVEQVT